MQSAILLLCLLLAVASAFKPTRMWSNSKVRNMKSTLDMKMNGKVKFFDSLKGYGFITPDDGSDDVFVHQTSVLAEGFRSLAEGEPVEYDVSTDPNKGNRKFASNVTGPNGAYVQGAPRREDGRY